MFVFVKADKSSFPREVVVVAVVVLGMLISISYPPNWGPPKVIKFITKKPIFSK